MKKRYHEEHSIEVDESIFNVELDEVSVIGKTYMPDDHCYRFSEAIMNVSDDEKKERIGVTVIICVDNRTNTIISYLLPSDDFTACLNDSGIIDELRSLLKTDSHGVGNYDFMLNAVRTNSAKL